MGAAPSLNFTLICLSHLGLTLAVSQWSMFHLVQDLLLDFLSKEGHHAHLLLKCSQQGSGQLSMLVTTLLLSDRTLVSSISPDGVFLPES